MQRKRGRDTPNFNAHMSLVKFASTSVPLGYQLLALVKVARHIKFILCLAIIALALFGASLLVALATNPTLKNKIYNLFSDGRKVRVQSSSPEALPASDNRYFRVFRPGD